MESPGDEPVVVVAAAAAPATLLPEEATVALDDQQPTSSSEESRTVVLRSPNGTLVHIVGTMHVSEASCADVRALIRRVKPAAVAVELCKSRISMLHMTSLKSLSFQEMLTQYRTNQNSLFALLYGSFLGKVAGQLEILPGAEFRAAYEEATKLEVKLYLVDRPVGITIARVWAALSTWEKTRFCTTMVWQSLFLPSADELKKMMESLKETDMLMAALKECQDEFPSLLPPLLTERDLYLAAKLRSCADKFGSLVAVVGAGHVAGIVENWEKPIDVASLLVVPAARRTSRVVKLGVLAGVVGAFAGSIYGSFCLCRLAVRCVRR